MTNNMIVEQRWVCGECGHIATDSDLLSAESPFRKDDKITGCPSCYEVNSFTGCCDEPDGWIFPTAVTPQWFTYEDAVEFNKHLMDWMRK